jgi:hypothetical protein
MGRRLWAEKPREFVGAGSPPSQALKEKPAPHVPAAFPPLTSAYVVRVLCYLKLPHKSSPSLPLVLDSLLGRAG